MITTNTGLKALSHLLLMLMLICSPVSVIFSQQTITSNCTSPKHMEAHAVGIHNTGNKNVTLDSGTNRVTMECVCRDRGNAPCPNTVTFTIRRPNGTTQQVVATAGTVNVGNDYTGGYPMRIYRTIYNGTADRVTYNAPPAASRPSMRGLVVWQESVGNGIPNVPNNYIVDRFLYRELGHTYYINVPSSSVSRNVLIQIPVHEHSNNPNRPIIYQVRGYNGNTAVTSPVNRTITDNNDEGEIRLDEINLNNVPTNVNRIRVNIQSPESNGGSFIIGSIMATSTPCCVPTLTCPSNITRSTDTGRCDYTVQGGVLDPTFSCAATPTNSYNGNTTLAGATFSVGTTTITWTAGSETCQTSITVEDNEVPVLTCPSDITIETDPGLCVGTYDWLPPAATDNCDASEGIIVICSHQSGDTFPSGTTTVTCTATDAGGNIGTCSFDITVEDREAPFMSCLSDITVIAEAGVCESSPEWMLPRALDNCDLNQAVIICSHQPGDTFPVGMTTVTCTATDVAGNSTSHDFDVIVEQCDTCVTTVTIIHIDDNDFNIGTNDMESFFANPLIRFFNPGLPETGILTNVTLELHLRVFGMSCEDEIEVRVTDPMGNITTFEQAQLFSTCNGAGLYYITLDLPDVPLEGNGVGTWYIEFRDINDQNAGAREYSTRFAQLTYDATFDECYDVNNISKYNENELLSELSEVRLYPVPTSDVLNMEYTSDENTDLSIEVIDGSGRLVGTQKESVISGVNTFNMNIQDLAQGLYYLRIMDNVGRMQVKPFTKINP